MTCPTPGKMALGGGFQLSAASSSDLSKIADLESYPSAVNQWTAKAVETSAVTGTWTLSVYIICGNA